MGVHLLRRLHLVVGLLTVLFGVGLLSSVPVSAASPSSAGAVAQAPAQVRDGSAVATGAYNPAQTIRLAVGLKPPHMAEEQEYLSEIQDKSSPLFHAYLSPSQWTTRFGPTAAAQNAVVSWAKKSGLTVTHLYPNRLVVDVAGTVGAIESALSVQINSYKLGTQTFFANSQDPALPATLSGIVASIDGLSSLQTMFPASPTAHEPASPDYVPGPVVANGPSGAANGSQAALRAAERTSAGNVPNITNGSYDPTDLYSSEAYDYTALNDQGHCCNPLGDPTSSPAQTSIAIATFGAQNISDMAGFQSQYSYLAYNVQEVNIDGTPACCDAEGTMDMEWSTAMANDFGGYQSTAKVYLYDGANFNDSTFTDMYNQMVSDNAARVFSTSWSCTESYGCSTSTINTRDAIFSEMVGQGWTLTAASGDRGAYDDCNHLSVSFPASDPNVVGAGGTELSLNSSSQYVSETTWSGGPDGCGSNDGGSGGGCSSVFSAPAFQTNQPCGSGSRGVPDLSLNADWYHTPQNIYFDGSLSGNAGTSIVAPELAGFFAQEDSYLLFEGNICGTGTSVCAPLGNANYPIYETGLVSAPHDPFYDITSGCNGNNVGTGYCAGSGYDLATGWGSANMLQLAWAFNWHLLADDGRPVVTFSGPTPGVWYKTDQTVGVSVADTGGGYPASGVAGFSDAWNTDPGDPFSEATPGSGNSFYGGPEFVNATSGTLDLAAEGQGCNTVNVESWDNMGYQSGDVTDGPLCYDSVPPTITSAPQVTLKNKVGPVGTTEPVTVSWAATDATSGVKSYALSESEDGGAYSLISIQKASSKTVNLAFGHKYTFSVRATDNAGNESVATIGSSYKLTLNQETSGFVAYSSGWTRQALSGANGGFVDFATAKGDTATLTFSGLQAAWISTKGTTYGAATAQLDATAPQTVINTNATTEAAEVVDVVTPATSGTHHLVITVRGTSGHPRIDVDAFVVLSH